MSSPRPDPAQRPVALWLLACCALVFAMVVVGGITRLTHSGLSIVEWQPLVGALPPLNERQWEETFAKYRETPEFRLRNHDMTLAGFKGIFFWEYLHRLLGRLVGAVFFIPFLYFLARGRIRGTLAWKLGAIFALGALQGALGWFMVKSGLVDDPRVSPVRLAAHLGMAFLLLALMAWTALDLLVPEAAARDSRRSRTLATVLVAVVFGMVLSGALVAGIRAGYAYNTWPLMNGQWIPGEILLIDPWWDNFVYNMATVQFDHRGIAYLVAAIAVATWLSVRAEVQDARARRWAHALLAAVAVQIALGISTLLLRVPVPLAAVHQAGAVIVFACAIALRHALRAPAQLHK
jgi:cytochrome c oxidase assembly protein subunit 15